VPRPRDQLLSGCGEAAEQRDAADEGRVDAGGSITVGRVIVNQGKVVHRSQLIASVRRTYSVRATETA